MKLSVLLLFAFVVTTKCQAQISVFTTNWNDHIDAVSRKQIKLLDDIVTQAFYEGDTTKLIGIYSDRLKLTINGKTNKLLTAIHPLILNKSYSLLDEYLTKNAAVGSELSVFKSLSNDNSYKVNFKSFTSETYTSLILSKGTVDELLISCLYGKYNGRWKLDAVYVGQFRIADKSAIDFYNLAQKYYAEGDIIDAALMITMTGKVVKPSVMFEYVKFKEILSFKEKVYKEIKSKYSFPFVVASINTAPKIFSVSTVTLKEGVFPIVEYLTSVKLSDVAALKAEDDKIQKEIGKLFPGIDKNNASVFFKAYNQIPDGKTKIEHYGFVLKSSK